MEREGGNPVFGIVIFLFGVIMSLFLSFSFNYVYKLILVWFCSKSHSDIVSREIEVLPKYLNKRFYVLLKIPQAEMNMTQYADGSGLKFSCGSN